MPPRRVMADAGGPVTVTVAALAVAAVAVALCAAAVTWTGRPVTVLTAATVLLAAGLGASVAQGRALARSRGAVATRYRILLRSTGDAIFGLDTEGCITVVNPVAEEVTGRSRDELLGVGLGDLLDTSAVPDCDDAASLVRTVLDGGDGRTIIEASVRRPGIGGRVPVDVTLSPVVDEEVVIGAVAVVRDVSDRVRRDEQLRSSEERAWQVIETAADAFVEMDETGAITLWNTAARDLFGWEPHEVRGRPVGEVLVPERHRGDHEAGLRRFLATGEPKVLGVQLQLSALHRDGHEIPVELTPWFAPNADGSVRFAAFLRDITDRVRVQQVLRDSERRLLQAEEVGGFGTWEFDVTTGEVVWSPGAFRVNDRDPDTFEPSFEGWLGTVHPDDRDRAMAAVNETLASRDRYELEYRMIKRDGEVRLLRTVGTVERNEAGQPLRLLGTARDVTEERLIEQMKDEFTAIASHELRTPLTSIHGALTLIESGAFGALPSQATGLIEVATRNTERLVRLIDELLDVQRLTDGKVSLRTEVVRMAWLLEEAVETMRGQAEPAGVSLEADVGEDLDLVIDPDRFVQVLTNVIGNAIRFSSRGDRVVVRGERDGDGVRITVTDSGLGIPPDKTARIFERFRQADTSDARERDGSGLGLAIAKELVELHDGRIRAESEGLGEGTRIVIDLPCSRIAEPGGSEPTVLVCDDNADLRFLTVERLRRLGLQTVEAGSGSEAVSLFTSLQPEVVIMDILLPDADGRDVIRRLRGLEGGPDAAMVVVSALDEPVDWKACGADRWLTKPVDKGALSECMEAVARPRTGEPRAR